MTNMELFLFNTSALTVDPESLMNQQWSVLIDLDSRRCTRPNHEVIRSADS